MNAEGVRAVWDKYRYAILVMALGAGLMLWPTGQRVTGAESVTPARTEVPVPERDLQEEMRQTLGKIQGVGQVWVLLTEDNDGIRTLARNRRASFQGDAYSESSETVLTDAGSGNSVVVTTTQYPAYRGALVVCEGGDLPAVRLAVTEAVSALTGLPANRVAVVKCQ